MKPTKRSNTLPIGCESMDGRVLGHIGYPEAATPNLADWLDDDGEALNLRVEGCGALRRSSLAGRDLAGARIPCDLQGEHAVILARG
jgi:hypothetical protein